VKKRVHSGHKKLHREISENDTEESATVQDSSIAEQSAVNPFSRFARFIKKKLHRQREAPESVQEQSLKQPSTSAKTQKPEFDAELKNLIASNDDAVNKLYQLDLILRRYYRKEYKIGKKLQYPEMITQLEQEQENAAANLIKKIVEYAYSGKPLENPQIQELLSDFQQLIASNIARHFTEKELRRKRKSPETQIETQEKLADKLTPIAPQLPPQNEPFVHLPSFDLRKYRKKLQGVLNTIAKIRPRAMFAGVKLPSVLRSNQQKKRGQELSQHSPTPHTAHLHLRLPQLRLPTISKRDMQELDVRHPIKKASNAVLLHLPKIRLPEFNRHESHAPRVKLPSWRPVKENIAQKIVSLHLPQLRLPETSNIRTSWPHFPQFKKLREKTLKTKKTKLPSPKTKRFSARINMPKIRKLLHLPKSHPSLYYERIKEHIPEIHPIEYVRSFTDRIPRPHPREYYESLKQTMQEKWERIHPPKYSEEEQALQKELAQEQAETEQQAQTATPPEVAPETLPIPKTPIPILAKPETYWVEYLPRKHTRTVKHHVAFNLDDFHHVKEILRKHNKASLI
jgi:hypothetical protein